MPRRKRPRLFSFSREVELAHFDEVVTEPEDRPILESIIDGFIAISKSHQLTDEALAPFVRGARHPLAQIRGLAITRLSVLTHYFAEAADALARLCHDPDPEVRRYASSAVANTPAGVGMPLLDTLLTDDAWRVRKAAAQAAGAVVWPGLGDVLEGHLGAEGDARVRVMLSLSLAFQRERAVE